jgi:hypothetical protein
MMKKQSIFASIVISVIFLFTSTHLLHAGITNGDFSADLSIGWTVESGYVDWWLDSSARLAPDYDEDTYFLHSTLSQIFTMDAGSQMLSFDLTMETGGGETDVFTAYLLNPLTGDPLISIVGKDYFFSLSSDGDIEDELVSVTGDTIWLDVSGLAGSNVKIVFDLEHDYSDEVDTYAFLDNVNVSLIPAPCALIRGSIGVGFVAWLRRRRMF